MLCQARCRIDRNAQTLAKTPQSRLDYYEGETNRHNVATYETNGSILCNINSSDCYEVKNKSCQSVSKCKLCHAESNGSIFFSVACTGVALENGIVMRMKFSNAVNIGHRTWKVSLCVAA